MFANLLPDEQLYIALYELADEELIGLILQHAEQVHLILSNTGADKESGEWDAENAPYRARLRAAEPRLAEMHDRMFNNAQHIGHNKFVVRVDDHGQAQSVLSGSTNWTPNGLCAQSNNMYIAKVPDLARQFLDYWQAIKQDNAGFTVPTPLSEGTHNVQGASLRQQNAAALDEVATDSGKLRLWRSPNTKQVSKPAKLPAMPPDLAEVFGYVRQARRAIFFAVFLPSQQGLNSIVSETIDIARKDTSLLVYGAVSSPLAMPNYIPPQHLTNGDDDGSGDKYQPSLFDEGKVHVVRANALTDDLVGNFEKEVLSAGNAIIHDKLIVIDPLSDDCTVIVGSHNLGFKASYANDDNLLIIRGDRRLAEAYMVHAIDLYEHYHFRAVQYERHRRDQQSWSGFLSTDDHWLAKYPDGASDLSQYLAS
jgi:phosphatidylserine/phosphatidylglycerophosphate/cardiolipin synthase-like enzyme